jgi:circadian clock protein KaiB
MDKYLLKLYVTGRTPRSQQAIDNLRSLIADNERYELEIIDVLEEPEKAEAHKVLATPTLVRELPPPLRRVIGDLSDRQQVLLGLELEELGHDNGEGGSGDG